MKFFFKKIRLIFDIENWLWKYNFGTFWGPGAMSIYKIQQFHLNNSWFLSKTLLFRIHQVRKNNVLLFARPEFTCFRRLCILLMSVGGRFEFATMFKDRFGQLGYFRIQLDQSLSAISRDSLEGLCSKWLWVNIKSFLKSQKYPNFNATYNRLVTRCACCSNMKYTSLLFLVFL